MNRTLGEDPDGFMEEMDRIGYEIDISILNDLSKSTVIVAAVVTNEDGEHLSYHCLDYGDGDGTSMVEEHVRKIELECQRRGWGVELRFFDLSMDILNQVQRDA